MPLATAGGGDATTPRPRRPTERPTTSALDWAEDVVLQYRSLRAHQLRFIVRSVRRERRRTRDALPSGFGRSHEDVRWLFAGEEDVVYRTFPGAIEAALPPMAEWGEEAVATSPEIADPRLPIRTPTLKRSRRRSFSPLPLRKKRKRLQQAVAADVSEEETEAMDVGEPEDQLTGNTASEASED